jgi:hypothetical protein
MDVSVSSKPVVKGRGAVGASSGSLSARMTSGASLVPTSSAAEGGRRIVRHEFAIYMRFNMNSIAQWTLQRRGRTLDAEKSGQRLERSFRRHSCSHLVVTSVLLMIHRLQKKKNWLSALQRHPWSRNRQVAIPNPVHAEIVGTSHTVIHNTDSYGVHSLVSMSRRQHSLSCGHPVCPL